MELRKKSINVLSAYNQVGLEKDLQILSKVLREAGHEVEENDVKQKSLYFRLHNKPVYDINLFCEILNPFWIKAAKQNWLIPNQEVFAVDNLKILPEVSKVLCKTHYAESIFQKLGCRTAYIGFTSQDRWLNGIKKKKECFHLAGKSPFKGTDILIETWKNHPEFPMLTMLEHPFKKRDVPNLPNLKYICGYLPNDELKQLQNEYLYHLCPSVTEGFGHYIMEALTCKSVVLTTDAPPMNELVTTERGVLCPYGASSLRGLGTNFYVKPIPLAEKVIEMLDLSQAQIESKTEKARHFYEENERQFKQRLLDVFQ